MPRLTLDLSPPNLLLAYANGIFPMATSRTSGAGAEGGGGGVEWFTADPRAILPLDAFHIPRGLRRALKKHPFTLRTDTAFRDVMLGCAMPRKTDGDTWINDDIINAYCQLHDLGYAHSVEAWAIPGGSELPIDECRLTIEEDQTNATAQSAIGNPQSPILMGGLYGVALGGAFFGESMFSRATDASKICLVHLVEHLRARGFTLLDVQFRNPHLDQFGIIELPRTTYLRQLQHAIDLPVTW